MKILIADKYPESGQQALTDLGCQVRVEPDAKGDALIPILEEHGSDILIVRSNKVSGEALMKSRLSLVIRAGAGYNTIDVKTASALGIYVANCPGKNSIAVAELAFGLMLALDRRIAENDRELKSGAWNKKEYSKAQGVFGRTLGLIGLGSIGQEMVARARGFGMPVVAWSRSLTPEKAAGLGVEFAASPAEVAEKCHVLSVHVALKDETRGFIDGEILDRLRPGSIFINTARDGVVDHQALARVMKEKNIRAGLDVHPNEPPTGTAAYESPLAEIPGFLATHHIGASTDQAQEAIADEVTRIVMEFKDTGDVPNVVNLARRTPAKTLLVVRHRDRVGVLAHVLHGMKKSGINVQEMENIVFDGAEAAIARIQLDREPSEEDLSVTRRGNEDILDLTLLPIQ